MCINEQVLINWEYVHNKMQQEKCRKPSIKVPSSVYGKCIENTPKIISVVSLYKD